MREVNPLMAQIITTWWGILVKFFLTCGVAFWLYYREAKKTLNLITMFMSLVILNNLIALIFFIMAR